MAKNLVVKDNALINASYNLELVEQRLILLAIVEARASGKGITPNDRLTIPASSYMNNYDTNRNTAYQALKDACDNLFERQFSYIETNAKGNTEVVRSRWVSEIRYVVDEASVKLVFSPTVAPLITQLEKNFTSYELEQVAQLNSKYAVRLYEIVIAWRSTGKTPMIAIDELRDRLGVLDDEYGVTADFKRWVLDKPIKQINDKTDITITYEQHKNGRKIIGFTFAVEQKQKPKASAKPKKTKDNDRDPNTPDIFEGLTDAERGIVEKEVQAFLDAKESKGEKLSEKHIENIRKKALKERWGLDKYEKEQKEKAEKQEQKEIAKKRKQAQAEKWEEFLSAFDAWTPDEQEDFINLVDGKAAETMGVLVLKTFRTKLAGTPYRAFVSDPTYAKHFLEAYDELQKTS